MKRLARSDRYLQRIDLRSLAGSVPVPGGSWAGSEIETEHLVLSGPTGWSVAKIGNTDTVRELAIDGSLHEGWRQERERDCEIDLADGAAFACCDVVRAHNLAVDDLVEPTAATRDCSDESGACLGADRPRG